MLTKFYTCLMTNTALTEIACNTKRAILHTLIYFEIFKYPLRVDELLYFCREKNISLEILKEKLQILVKQGLVFQFGVFFQSQNDATWVPARLQCNHRADVFLPIATRKSKLISKFPFVRGVFVSGSLSKHCVRPDGDIDFFIVTTPGRLWLSRTLLILYKKLILLNSHKYFCVNYFIDSDHLEIEEKNLFTATETVTLLPLFGGKISEDFRKSNHWAWREFPNMPVRSAARIPDAANSTLKKGLEKVFEGKLGNWLDKKAMSLTLWFWKRKFRHLNEVDFELALKSRQYVSKHHPLHFQEKVLSLYDKLLAEKAGVV
ncbi:MAG: hypothetical protein R2778_17590 [Saprospiraceae bacterium]